MGRALRRCGAARGRRGLGRCGRRRGRQPGCAVRQAHGSPSDRQVAYLLDEVGLDAAFNYKKGPVADLLRAAAPDGIDVYFDTVGGDHLEAALGAMRRHGRVALCGAISQYEQAGPPCGPSNLFQATANDLTLRGFRGSTNLHLMDEMQRQVGAWLRDGSLAYRETVVDGLERAPEALVRVLSGDTVGKTLVRIA
jgi:NADPH-dependent curcumin reductase CurA